MDNIFLLQEINKQANQKNLREGMCGGRRSENEEHYSTLSDEEIATLVEMVVNYMNDNDYDPNDMDQVTDFVYDLLSDIPGLEDSFEQERALEQIVRAYQARSR